MRAGSIVSAAVAALLIGLTAETMASGAPADQSVGASSSTPPWNIAQKPRYERGFWQCAPGLVWRNAGSTDWLCVDPAEAQRVEKENADAASDADCPPGMVRREAFRKDAVCVDPARRDAVRQMNMALYVVR